MFKKNKISKKGQNIKLSQYKFKTKSYTDIKDLPLSDLKNFLTSKSRRKILRGFSQLQLKIYEKCLTKDNIKIMNRDLLILPCLVNKILHVHNGKQYLPVTIEPEHVGRVLGQLIKTRLKIIAHVRVGKGGTKGSRHTALK